jgi:hypothetical protein
MQRRASDGRLILELYQPPRSIEVRWRSRSRMARTEALMLGDTSLQEKLETRHVRR